MVLSDCLVDLNRQTDSPPIYVGTVFNIPVSTYSLKITYQKCDGDLITDNYATMEVRKGGSLIATYNFHPGGDAVIFDNNNLCVGLTFFECKPIDPAQWWTAYRVWYNADPCLNVSCPDKCYGSDLWSMKCDPATGLCVQDVLKQAGSPICSATHYLDLKLHPHPWYTPQQAADKAILLIAEINGAITNWMTFLTGWTYLGTTIAADGTTVLIRIYLREESSAPAPASMHIHSLGGPITLGQIALVVVAIGFISVAVGTIFSAIFGPKDAGQDVGLKNGNVTAAGGQFSKGTLSDCATSCDVDSSLTQDQKAACIKKCYDDFFPRWKQYNEDLFPDADLTPLSDALVQIQNCYETYNSSGKTQQDYDTLKACMKLKSDEGIDKGNDNIINIYPPDAPAGSKEVPGAEDCWIPGLAGGCILSAKTGKTIAIIGGIVIGGVLIFSLIKK